MTIDGRVKAVMILDGVPFAWFVGYLIHYKTRLRAKSSIIEVLLTFPKITHGSSRDGYLYSYYEVVINKGCYTPMYILYPYALDHPKSKSIPFLKIRYVATFL